MPPAAGGNRFAKSFPPDPLQKRFKGVILKPLRF